MAVFLINLFLALCCRSLGHRSNGGGILSAEMMHYTSSNKQNHVFLYLCAPFWDHNDLEVSA